jgi:hypothetical protein
MNPPSVAGLATISAEQVWRTHDGEVVDCVILKRQDLDLIYKGFLQSILPPTLPVLRSRILPIVKRLLRFFPKEYVMELYRAKVSGFGILYGQEKIDEKQPTESNDDFIIRLALREFFASSD